MATVDILQRELVDSGLSAEALIEAIRSLREHRLVDRHIALPRAERAVLRQGSGVRPEDVATAAAKREERQARLAVLESVQSSTAWSAKEVADRLGKDRSAVSRMKTKGELYALPGRKRDLFPYWQFVVEADSVARVLPHLAQVLDALPKPTHPATMERFFITPRPFYVLDGKQVSAAEWLAAGGDVDMVLADAASLHVLG